MTSRIQLWSSGGGTQSSAIAALIYVGKLRPDISVIVDTEREASEVWDYLDKWVMPALQSVGVTLYRVPKSAYATVDLFGGKNGDDILIPAFTDETGKIGKLPTYCSNEWKRRVVNRFVGSLYPRTTQFNKWIGFTIDEMRRVYQEPGRWEPKFPLIELRLTRADCTEIVKKVGWPPPPRSSCWMCPNRSHSEWMHLKHHSPGDWQKAIQFEKEIRLVDDAVWLTKSGKPLSELPDQSTDGEPFVGRCDRGNCFI